MLLFCCAVVLFSCAVVLLCCCFLVLLFSCAVVLFTVVVLCCLLLYCCTEGCKQHFACICYIFPISIKFGTPDNHRLLIHYEFHENRHRGINVILTVVAMFIVRGT